MKWITALDLQRWAETVRAREQFPALIGDLIRASVDGIDRFRFPSGDKSQVRGFDGVLSTDTSSKFVPEGDSIWEFGVNKGALQKWTSDYAKRTASTPDAIRDASTFVFVSPWTWDSPGNELATQVASKKAEGLWKDVRCIDGSQLETWLGECPAVAAYYAKTALNTLPVRGVRSSEQVWEEYANRFSPMLSESVVSCGRNKQADDIRATLLGGPSVTTLVADSPDEALAFVVASVRTAEPEVRAYLESRLLLISDVEAARTLVGRSDLVLLLADEAVNVAGAVGAYAPVVVGAGRDIKGRSFSVLERPSTDALAKALQESGIDEARARLLAHSCGRSVTILERRIPSGAPRNPVWLDQADLLVPAAIAGGWDSSYVEDRRIIAELAQGKSYSQYESELCRLLRLPEPVIDREQSIWRMRAPIDAFAQIAHLITESHLTQFRNAFVGVFSVIKPEPSENEEFHIRARDAEPYSSWLREGLASTLLHIAVLHEEAGLNVAPSTPKEFVEDIVARLPGLKSDARLWKSLRDELPYLAEAAPGPFTQALESLLEGNGTGIAPLFAEREGFLAPYSDLPPVLWSLELLAWDPAYLRKVARLLAALACVDPGGRLGNRPINSLRTIFVSWCPSTNATLDERIGVLEEIVKDFPAISWDLISKLLPRDSDTAGENMKPRLRESGLSERERLTYGHVWKAQDHVVRMAIALAGGIAVRWEALVPVVNDVRPDTARTLVEALKEFLDRAEAPAREVVWSAVRSEVARGVHLHGDAASTLLASLVENYEPGDAVAKGKWLFDDWTPLIGGDYEGYQDRLDELRNAAVRDVFSARGSDGIIELASAVKLQQFVAASFAATAQVDACLEVIRLALRVEGNALDTFAAALSAATFDREDDACDTRLIDFAEQLRGYVDNSRIAMLFFHWRDQRRTWRVVEALGQAVVDDFWKEKPSWRLAHADDLSEASDAVRRYLAAGRPLAALDAMERISARVDLSLLESVMDGALAEAASGSPRSSLLSLVLERVLNGIRQREDTDLLRVARWEMAWFPLLRNEKSLTLFALLDSHPELYVELLTAAYRSAAAERTELTPEGRTAATLAHRVLMKFRAPPGLVAEPLDANKFISWATRVRSLAKEADRSAIADIHLGMLIAHSPPSGDSHVWPAPPVADVIEVLDAHDVERGIYTERFNMRGVVTKALREGGSQERELSDQYAGWAKAWSARPRIANLLRVMAERWHRYADDEDVRARQDSLRD